MKDRAPAIAAIVPVGTLEGSKSRLGDALDAEERVELAERLLTRTLTACLDASALSDVLVISPDRAVLRRAADLGARTLRQRTSGLNDGLREARDDAMAGGAEAILVVPIDLAFIGGQAIDQVVEAITGSIGPAVVLVTDRHGSGTNVLGLRPPDVIDFAFGHGSRAAHRAAAAATGAHYQELDGPLRYDLDTPADLVLLESLDGKELHAG